MVGSGNQARTRQRTMCRTSLRRLRQTRDLSFLFWQFVAIIGDLAVNLQPGSPLLCCKMFPQQRHNLFYHVFTNSGDKIGTLLSDSDHYFAPVIEGMRALDISEFFQTIDQSGCCGGGVSHLGGDTRHGDHLLFVEITKQKILWKRNAAMAERFRELQQETALHLHDDL